MKKIISITMFLISNFMVAQWVVSDAQANAELMQIKQLNANLLKEVKRLNEYNRQQTKYAEEEINVKKKGVNSSLVQNQMITLNNTKTEIITSGRKLVNSIKEMKTLEPKDYQKILNNSEYLIKTSISTWNQISSLLYSNSSDLIAVDEKLMVLNNANEILKYNKNKIDEYNFLLANMNSDRKIKAFSR